MLSRFLVPRHVLILIFGKMVRRPFTNTFTLMYILGVVENDNIFETRYFSESNSYMILRKESNDFDPKFKYVVNTEQC